MTRRATSGTELSVPSASVVIPAYNEGRVLGRCLEALLDEAGLDLEIVVAPNGCTDDTAEVARSFPGVRVVDVPVASKSAALNTGDAAAHRFPRVFLDADIVLEAGALRSLVEALDVPRAVVGSPHVRFVTDECTRGVRLFYEAYRQVDYVRSGLVGLGVYGLSEAGRRRFERFPDLQADDLFVQRLFTADERLITEGHFDVRAPRDLTNLLAVRTRIAQGNASLTGAAESGNGPEVTDENALADFSSSTGSTMRSLLEAVRRRPALAPGVATYAGVVTAARCRALFGDGATWHRDESTR